jgi:1-acyl-sn-glycerol-3-phosphate acyltransferase
VFHLIAPVYIFMMERVLGWRIEGASVTEPKCILLTEPHTSNFDLLIVFYWALKVRRRVWFIIKKETETWFVIGKVLRWAGAIFIDRSAPMSTLKAILREVRAHEQFVLLIAPTGTRHYTEGWKPGFYYLAQKTNMPLIPCGADFARKRAVIAPPVFPSGDIHADIEAMRPFYEQITPKHPERAAPVRLLPENKQQERISV